MSDARIFIFLTLLSTIASDKCTENVDKVIYRRLATKTPYRHLQNNDTKPLEFNGCIRADKIWSLVRHGTRNPSKKNILQMKVDLTLLRDNFIDNRKNKLCSSDLEEFRFWSNDLETDNKKILVAEGVDELFSLGKRFKERFPDLLDQRYNKDVFNFKYTKTERAQRSAELFVEALFGVEDAKNVEYPESVRSDPVLRFYKGCARWKRDVDKNPDVMKEVDLFKSGKEMKKVVGDISRKLGTFVDADDVQLMYTACAFETAWNKTKISPWCRLFDDRSIKVLEFLEDLEYYWIDGYGYELTYKQACSAFRDLFDRFKNPTEERSRTFYFTHSGTILKSLAFLGLFRDDTLTHKDYAKDRLWKVSEIDAFATNLAFVRYE